MNARLDQTHKLDTGGILPVVFGPMSRAYFALIVSCFYCVFLASGPAWSQDGETTAPAPVENKAPAANSSPDFESLFKAGVEFYQTKSYDKARDAFDKAVQLQPHNASALTNLALSYYQIQQKGWAIALFRKALSLQPELTTARAGLKHTLSQLEVKEIPHQIETYETLRAQVLQPVTLLTYLILTALLLLASGWFILAYFEKRKNALESESALPNFPIIASLLSFCFVISTLLLAMKAYDLSIPRGTVVSEKVSVQSAPGEQQVVLFELYTGLEVIIQNEDKDWIQVTYPGASTGWIPKKSVFITSGF